MLYLVSLRFCYFQSSYMKLLLSIVFGFSLIAIANAQDVANYYRLVDSAELAIVENNFSESVKFYYKAEKIRPMFGRDLHNAAIAASKVNDLNNVIFFTKKMAEKGYDLSNFKNSKSGLQKFYNEIVRACQSVRLLPSINKKYCDTLQKMIKLDQEFLKPPEFRKANKDTIDKIFIGNAMKLVQLIYLYGFPSEERIGIDTIADPAVLMIHQRGGEKNRVVDFSNIVRTAVLNGELNNKTGSFLIENSEGKLGLIYNCLSLMRGSFDTFVMAKSPSDVLVKKDTTYFTNWGTDPISDSTKNAFNKRRKELYLDSVEDSFKKAVFQNSHPEFNLGNRDSGVTIMWRNYANFLYMQNNFKDKKYR
jgi:hypothetical protein